MMTLPAGLGELDFSDWVRGILAAFIGGGASAVTSGMVVSLSDPKDYAIGSAKFFSLVGAVFVMSGFMNAMAFLRTKPLPEMKKVERTVATTEAPGKSPIVVSTVKETSIEPK